MLVLGLFVACSSCASKSMQDYYSREENYIRATGTITHIFHDEENKVLYLEFCNLEPAMDDTCFKLVGDNYELLMSRGIRELEIGQQIEFVTAPKYFGDGYVMPLVEVTVNGKCYLGFLEGKENLLKWLDTQ